MRSVSSGGLEESGVGFDCEPDNLVQFSLSDHDNILGPMEGVLGHLCVPLSGDVGSQIPFETRSTVGHVRARAKQPCRFLGYLSTNSWHYWLKALMVGNTSHSETLCYLNSNHFCPGFMLECMGKQNMEIWKAAVAPTIRRHPLGQMGQFFGRP